jgi:uncharacterized protein (TIRG00374 family)
MAPMRAPAPASLRRRWLFRLAASVAILAALFAVVPFRQTWQAIHSLPAGLWEMILAGYLGVHLLGVLKYRMVLNTAGAGIGFRGALRCYATGLFGVLFLPSVVGGDVLRAGLALRLARNPTGVVLGSVVDRFIDVISLGVLTLVGLVVARPAAVGLASARAIGAALLAIVLTAMLGWQSLRWLGRRSFVMRRRLVRLRRAWRTCLDRPVQLGAAWLLSLAAQSGFLALAAWLAAGCGLKLPWQAWVFAWPLAKLSALVPLTQGGIGVREAALVALLLPFGAPATLVMAAGLAWETVVIAGALLSGAAALLVGRGRPLPGELASPLPAPPASTLFG